MKRVLILANNDVGLYKFRKELIYELLKEHEVYLSLPYGELVEPLIKKGCHFIDTPVDRRGINPFTDFKLMVRYYSMMKKVQPDLVITYTIKPNLYGGMVARINRIPYAMNITGLGTAFQCDNLIKKLVCFLYKLASKKAKVVFFENKENQQIFIQNQLVSAKQTTCLNGAGVNLEEYPFTPYPITHDIHFLFIGRVMKEKGIDELLQVATKIKEQYKHIVFDIVGPMEDDYAYQIKQLADQDTIQYHGYQEDVKPFIKQCHCFILPSYHEGMANTLLECASMGRPLITSNIHGCKETINNNGFVCKVKDAHDLYLKVKQFIELDDEQKQQLALQSRKHVEEVFDKRKVVEETMKGLGI